MANRWIKPKDGIFRVNGQDQELATFEFTREELKVLQEAAEYYRLNIVLDGAPKNLRLRNATGQFGSAIKALGIAHHDRKMGRRAKRLTD